MNREDFKKYLKSKGLVHKVGFCGDGPVMEINADRHFLNVLMPSNPNDDHLPCVEQFIRLRDVLNSFKDVMRICDVQILPGETHHHCQRLSLTSLYQEIEI